MKTDLEKTLDEVLQYTHVPSLPPIYDEKSGDVWIKAIVLVTKSNGRKNYAVAKVDYNSDKPRIVKDFGVSAMIIRIDEIRPFYYLKDEYIVHFKNKDEIINYLDKELVDFTKEELSKKKNDSLKKMLYNIFIQKQLKAEKQK